MTPNDLAHIPLDGFTASWSSDSNVEELSIDFENEAWTLQGIVSGVDVHFVVRMNAMWNVQQMLLFRDLDEPDLWLANDGSGRWGEINGAQRRELGGCEDIDIRCSALTRTLAVRRLRIEPGCSVDVHSVVVDPDTLSISRALLAYTRLETDVWLVERDDGQPSHTFSVDRYGFPLDIPGHFVRQS